MGILICFKLFYNNEELSRRWFMSPRHSHTVVHICFKKPQIYLFLNRLPHAGSTPIARQFHGRGARALRRAGGDGAPFYHILNLGLDLGHARLESNERPLAWKHLRLCGKGRKWGYVKDLGLGPFEGAVCTEASWAEPVGNEADVVAGP